MAVEESPLIGNKVSPVPPPLPGSPKGRLMINGTPRGYSCVSTATRDLWETLFDEGYRADVSINTDNGGIIYAHANILGVASPVLKNMLKQSKKHGHRRSISIRGVPYDAVQIFIRYLYTSRYEPQEMEKYALHLLVLSHAYMVPHLKQVCEWRLEHRLLSIENVVDTFQLALLCNAPRLGLISHRLILKNFKVVSATEGWQIMKKSHPVLEKKILVSFLEEETRQKERAKKVEREKNLSATIRGNGSSCSYLQGWL